MKTLSLKELLSINGGKKLSKECQKLMAEIEQSWEIWDTPKRESKVQEGADKCMD